MRMLCSIHKQKSGPREKVTLEILPVIQHSQVISPNKGDTKNKDRARLWLKYSIVQQTFVSYFI